MSEEEKKEKATAYQSSWPRRPEGPWERPWPSPIPLPLIPTADINRILKQILDRLGAMEKRLEKIEKLLAEKAASSI